MKCPSLPKTSTAPARANGGDHEGVEAASARHQRPRDGARNLQHDPVEGSEIEFISAEPPSAASEFRSGSYRIHPPRRFGGYEFDLATFYRVMLRFRAAIPRSAGAWRSRPPTPSWSPPIGPSRRKSRFLEATGISLPHRPPPLGTLTPADGGYVLNGTWDYCSGIPYATHVIVGAFAPGSTARRRGSATRWCLAAATRSLTTGAATGCSGCGRAGSNSVRIENLRVPEHHVAFLSAGLSSGPSPW